MLTNAMLFEKELRRYVLEEIERLKEALTVAPCNLEGPGGINHIQGRIHALKEMDDLIEAAKKAADQSSR
jgi:hypothetical protein